MKRATSSETLATGALQLFLSRVSLLSFLFPPSRPPSEAHLHGDESPSLCRILSGGMLRQAGKKRTPSRDSRVQSRSMAEYPVRVRFFSLSWRRRAEYVLFGKFRDSSQTLFRYYAGDTAIKKKRKKSLSLMDRSSFVWSRRCCLFSQNMTFETCLLAKYDIRNLIFTMCTCLRSRQIGFKFSVK